METKFYLLSIEEGELEEVLLDVLENPAERELFFEEYPDGPWWDLRETPRLLEKLFEIQNELPERWEEALLEVV